MHGGEQLDVFYVGSQAVAQSAAALLRAAGLHGHKYAIDAMLCATALRHPGRVTAQRPRRRESGAVVRDR